MNQTIDAAVLGTVNEKRDRQAGYTLVELMITALILIVVGSAVFALLSEIQTSASYRAEVQSVLNNARIALQTAERHIRQAGNDPFDCGLAGIDIVSASEVRIRSDRTGSSGAANPNKGDPDGDMVDSGENIIIRHNRTKRSLEIIHGGGPAQIVASNISALSMRYYNAEGHATTLGDEVRTIAVTVAGSALRPHPKTGRIFGIELTTNIRVLT
jgi:type II secretory pathway pseudopilin PulG